jgi:hypothetical protein
MIYPVATWAKLCRELARSQRAIRHKANQLGLRRRPERWMLIVDSHPFIFKFPHRVPLIKKEDAEAA